MNNGLKGADRVVFDAIMARQPARLSGQYLALLTGYSSNTIYASLRKLEELGLIERRRTKTGQTYKISVCGKQSEAA